MAQRLETAHNQPFLELTWRTLRSTEHCEMDQLRCLSELKDTHVLSQSRLLLINRLIFQLCSFLRLQVIVLDEIQVSRPNPGPRCSMDIPLSLMNSANDR